MGEHASVITDKISLIHLTCSSAGVLARRYLKVLPIYDKLKVNIAQDSAVVLRFSVESLAPTALRMKLL